jgi:hypothetical protein
MEKVLLTVRGAADVLSVSQLRVYSCDQLRRSSMSATWTATSHMWGAMWEQRRLFKDLKTGAPGQSYVLRPR